MPTSLPNELDKIEFPDPKIVNENQIMVSEYFGISCTSLESETSESLVTSDTENQLSSEMGVHGVESSTVNSIQAPKLDSPPSSVSTSGVSSPSIAASSESSDAPAASKTTAQEHSSAPKEKTADVGDGESDSSGAPSDSVLKPFVTVNIEPEQKVVQQDIVDMYMKSMQQFTESLAKMKLPLDIDNGPAESGNSSSEKKLEASKSPASRVFYGSRAFF
ncbi:hypothetical protein SLEP1_g51072 [Rubroshorea leprosula]|uniref:Uncharacterized protein n=1 Tax=Rubroshorea leprosula TaxID=152421 RepID=A0AAV5M235_9ROSI|nr:hypothetical protein SLEP1_g51072 [Rubroshorea leprosula]